MQQRVDPQGSQGSDIEFLGIAGVGFEDHLELVVHLHAVVVLTVTAIIGADGGFHISYVPGFWSQHTQGGSRVERPCTHLLVIRLPDQAAVVSPEVLQGEDDGLEVERFGHGGSLILEILVLVRKIITANKRGSACLNNKNTTKDAKDTKVHNGVHKLNALRDKGHKVFNDIKIRRRQPKERVNEPYQPKLIGRTGILPDAVKDVAVVGNYSHIADYETGCALSIPPTQFLSKGANQHPGYCQSHDNNNLESFVPLGSVGRGKTGTITYHW